MAIQDLDTFDKNVLADFLSENWAQFTDFTQERGITEADTEALHDRLSK